MRGRLANTRSTGCMRARITASCRSEVMGGQALQRRFERFIVLVPRQLDQLVARQNQLRDELHDALERVEIDADRFRAFACAGSALTGGRRGACRRRRGHWRAARFRRRRRRRRRHDGPQIGLRRGFALRPGLRPGTACAGASSQRPDIRRHTLRAARSGRSSSPSPSRPASSSSASISLTRSTAARMAETTSGVALAPSRNWPIRLSAAWVSRCSRPGQESRKFP